MGVERSVHVGHAHVHELSVVCADEHVQPRSRLLAAGQRSRSTGPSAIGILTAAVTPLAEAGISVFVLRMADQGDEVFLWAMLAEAAYEPEVPAVKDHPDLTRYVNAWGRQGDLGVVAEHAENGELLGAPGYGSGRAPIWVTATSTARRRSCRSRSGHSGEGWASGSASFWRSFVRPGLRTWGSR